MSCYEKWNLFSNFLIAFGTISAVIIAIFGNWISKKIFRAKLDVSILNDCGELTKHTNLQVIYYHLKVINLKKTVFVRNCRVFLKKVKKLQPNGEYIELPMSVSPQYHWAGSIDLCDARDVITENTLDFGFIEENSKIFHPTVNPLLDIFKGNLKANESFRYYLEIIADNYRPKKLFIFEVSWDGKWTSNLNEMKNSFIIRKIEK